MEEDTVIQTIRTSKAANFDLSSAGQQELAKNGVTAPVITAMKARAARKTVAAK